MKHLTPIVAGLVIALGGVLVASAQTYTPLAALPIGEGGSTPATWTLATYLTGAIKLLVASAGALAVVMLIIGGTQYVAAGINPSAKGDAKERIMNALIGLTLVLTSYLILYSIDPNLTKFSLTLPPVSVTQTAAAPDVAPPTDVSSVSRLNTSRRASSSRNGGTNTVTQTSNTTAAPLESNTTTASVTSLANSVALLQQNILNARINRANDFSIISNCMGNTSYDLCPRTDLNGDGVTNITDVSLFGQRGHSFDANQNGTVELQDAPAAVSCFFKMSTASIYTMLPRENWSQNWSDSGPNGWYLSGYSCGGGGGITGSPTLACNGATWIKASVLGSHCAVSNGFMNMPFGFVYGGGSQFSQFQSWIVGSSVGTAVNLTTLFKATFFRPVASDGGMPVDEYFETDVGKLTYATVAAYDLNSDGIADFSANGADIAVFNACRGSAVSGSCARADFNEDGTIDSRDLAFVNFMQANVFANSIIPLGWLLNWFESMFFVPTGYTDKQIISYCLGHNAFEKCASADVNADRMVDNTDLSAFNAGAPLLDFNRDGKVDLRL